MRYIVQSRKSTATKKRHSLLPTLLMLIVIALLFTQVAVSNRLATSGVAIYKIEEDIQNLSHANGDLTQQIASASSLMTLKEKAAGLGFMTTVKPIYLSQDLPVAHILP